MTGIWDMLYSILHCTTGPFNTCLRAYTFIRRYKSPLVLSGVADNSLPIHKSVNFICTNLYFNLSTYAELLTYSAGRYSLYELRAKTSDRYWVNLGSGFLFHSPKLDCICLKSGPRAILPYTDGGHRLAHRTIIQAPVVALQWARQAVGCRSVNHGSRECGLWAHNCDRVQLAWAYR